MNREKTKPPVIKPQREIRQTKTYRLVDRAVEKVRKLAFEKRITQGEMLEIMIFDYLD